MTPQDLSAASQRLARIIDDVKHLIPIAKKIYDETQQPSSPSQSQNPPPPSQSQNSQPPTTKKKRGRKKKVTTPPPTESIESLLDETPTQDQNTYTIEMVKSSLENVAAKTDFNVMKNILDKFRISKLGDLNVARYGEMIAECEKVLEPKTEAQKPADDWDDIL